MKKQNRGIIIFSTALACFAILYLNHYISNILDTWPNFRFDFQGGEYHNFWAYFFVSGIYLLLLISAVGIFFTKIWARNLSFFILFILVAMDFFGLFIISNILNASEPIRTINLLIFFITRVLPLWIAIVFFITPSMKEIFQKTK